MTRETLADRARIGGPSDTTGATRLLTSLVTRASGLHVKPIWRERLRVRPMDDGGMGSLRLATDEALQKADELIGGERPSSRSSTPMTMRPSGRDRRTETACLNASRATGCQASCTAEANNGHLSHRGDPRGRDRQGSGPRGAARPGSRGAQVRGPVRVGRAPLELRVLLAQRADDAR